MHQTQTAPTTTSHPQDEDGGSVRTGAGVSSVRAGRVAEQWSVVAGRAAPRPGRAAPDAARDPGSGTRCTARW